VAKPTLAIGGHFPFSSSSSSLILPLHLSRPTVGCATFYPWIYSRRHNWIEFENIF
jgi:hypothetical protein